MRSSICRTVVSRQRWRRGQFRSPITSSDRPFVRSSVLPFVLMSTFLVHLCTFFQPSPSLRSSVRPSVHPCVGAPVRPSVSPPVRPFTRPSVLSSVRSSILPFVCLSLPSVSSFISSAIQMIHGYDQTPISCPSVCLSGRSSVRP